MVDANSKNNICTEGHLKNNHPPPTIKNGPESFYKFALYFIQLKHCAHFAHLLTGHTEAALPGYLEKGMHQANIFSRGDT